MKLDFSKDGRFSLGFLHFAPSADDNDSFNLGKESIQTQLPNCTRNMAPNEGLLSVLGLTRFRPSGVELCFQVNNVFVSCPS